MLTIIFLLLSIIPVKAQKKSETPQKRDVSEYTFDLPKYVEQLKLELTYPLAWRNQQNMPFDLWKEKARAKVLECMMTPPKAANCFDPEIIGREKRDGYVALKVIISL